MKKLILNSCGFYTDSGITSYYVISICLYQLFISQISEIQIVIRIKKQEF